MAGILTVDGDTAAADARALLVRSEGHREARVVYTARVLLLLPSGAADSHAQAGSGGHLNQARRHRRLGRVNELFS